MNPRERIAKLQAMLVRVTTRAAAPRDANGGGAAREPVQALADEPVVSSEPITPLDVEVNLVDDARDASPAPPRASLQADAPAAESRERIIAAPELPVDAREADAGEAEAAPISAEPISVETADRSVASAAEAASRAPDTTESRSEPIEASEEEPPASSRRPIAIEPKLEELAFGEAAPVEAVPHTPPPESGRQVAAAPVDLDFDGEFTGVRPREPEKSPVTVLGTGRTDAPLVELAPEATAAKLPAIAAVRFEGAAATFKPASFGELLDATVAL